MRNSIIIATLALCCIICTIPACSQIKYTNMEKGEFCTYIKDSSVVLIDVRTPEEYNNGHIENAINIDFYSKTFTDEIQAAVPKNKKIALYCRSGKRSASAAEKLSPLGYNVVNLTGGYKAWSSPEEENK